MNTTFYQDQDFKYSEVAIAMEDFYYKDEGKFSIPIIFPELDKDTPYINSGLKGSTSNIVNYSRRHGVKPVTESNFVNMKVPIYIADSIKNENNTIIKGTCFIITFVGGEINDPHIIGVYE